jgi:hypothetical protein
MDERFRQKRARSASRSVGYAPICERSSFRRTRTGRPATAVASVGVESDPLDPRKLIIESLYSERRTNVGSVPPSLPNGTRNRPIPMRGGRTHAVRRVCPLGTTLSWPILQQRDYPVVPPLSAGCQGVLKPRRVASGPSEAALHAAVPNHAIFGVVGAPCQHLFAPSKTRSGASVARRVFGTSRPVVWVTLCGRWAARERARTREGVDLWRGHVPPPGRRCAHAMVSSSQPSAFSSMLPFMTTISLTEDDVAVQVKMARCGSFPRRHTARPFGSA